MRKITYLIAALVLSGSVQFANAQEPTVAAPTPTYPESDVISFYGKTRSEEHTSELQSRE